MVYGDHSGPLVTKIHGREFKGSLYILHENVKMSSGGVARRWCEEGHETKRK